MKDSNCPLQKALKVLGGKWTLVILWHLSKHPHRFNQLKREISSISTKVLSKQLSEMKTHGLISRHTIPSNPPQVEYRITSKGETLKPLMFQLYQWGEHFLDDSVPQPEFTELDQVELIA